MNKGLLTEGTTRNQAREEAAEEATADRAS